MAVASAGSRKQTQLQHLQDVYVTFVIKRSAVLQQQGQRQGQKWRQQQQRQQKQPCKKAPAAEMGVRLGGVAFKTKALQRRTIVLGLRTGCCLFVCVCAWWRGGRNGLKCGLRL